MRKCLLYYDARMNYENNKKGLFAYFQRMHCVHLLTETLDILRDKNIIKESGYGNKAVGTNATLPVNSYARMRLRDWLLKPMQTPSADGGTDTVPLLYTLRSRALLQELISWNSEGNFDRVSAMGMLMLLREDELAKCGGEPRREDDGKPEGILADPFFERYDKALKEADLRKSRLIARNDYICLS